jgi:hypothetical protein
MSIVYRDEYANDESHDWKQGKLVLKILCANFVRLVTIQAMFYSPSLAALYRSNYMYKAYSIHS